MSQPDTDPTAAPPAAAPAPAYQPYVPPPVTTPQAIMVPLGLSDPLRWLGRGWRDFMAAPGIGLFYGVCFWLMAALLALVFRSKPEYVMSIASGCLLVGPFLAMGLYEVSRRLETGEAVDVRDAMGANLVNTVAERLAPTLASLTGGTVGLRILTNLSDRRCARVRCRVPVSALATDGFSGAEVRDGIVRASRFAERDPYRAATHNKGVMNGVDAVVMATGNDWRAVEAGAHAYACRDGMYRPLTLWRAEGDRKSVV